MESLAVIIGAIFFIGVGVFVFKIIILPLWYATVGDAINSAKLKKEGYRERGGTYHRHWEPDPT
jgi:hypothetical protein